MMHRWLNYRRCIIDESSMIIGTYDHRWCIDDIRLFCVLSLDHRCNIDDNRWNNDYKIRCRRSSMMIKQIHIIVDASSMTNFATQNSVFKWVKIDYHRWCIDDHRCRIIYDRRSMQFYCFPLNCTIIYFIIDDYRWSSNYKILRGSYIIIDNHRCLKCQQLRIDQHRLSSMIMN